MKLDVTERLKDRSGVILAENGRDLTLRDVLLVALDTPLRGDENLGMPEKSRMYELGDRILREDTPALSAEEIALLKERVGKGCLVVVAGQVARLLDPDSVALKRLGGEQP